MNWQNLPVEVKILVYECCDHERWKALRLTSKSICEAVTTVLFSTIHLTPNTRSFDRALKVAGSPDLANHVREIVYHVGVLEDVHNGFPAFRDDIIRLHKPIGSTDDILKDVLWKYHCFSEEMQAQYDFETRNERADLRSICQPLTSLEAIVTILDSVDPFDLPQDYIGRRTGVHAVCSADGPHFSNLCYAMAGKTLTKISGRSMSWLYLSEVTEDALITIDLQSMKELAIGLDNSEFLEIAEDYQQRGLSALDGFLHACVNSERFYLRIDLDELPLESAADELLPISEVIFRHHWPNLVRLDLMGIVASEDDIIKFLDKHSSSLKSLHLDDIEIVAETTYNTDGSRIKTSGSILSLFRRIHEVLRLDTATITGNFTNRVTEAWYVDLDDTTTSCLRKQIERWLSHQGRSPFSTMVTSGAEGQGSSASVEGYSDDSWVWAGELLDEDPLDEEDDDDEEE